MPEHNAVSSRAEHSLYRAAVPVSLAVLLLFSGCASLASARREQLYQALVSDDPELRGAAVARLPRTDAETRRVLTGRLVAGFSSEDEGVCEKSQDLLVGMGAAAVPDLCGALKDEDWFVRCYAAETLGRIGPAAVDAVPALLEALRDDDENVRQEAVSALRSIGRDRARLEADIVRAVALLEALRYDYRYIKDELAYRTLSLDVPKKAEEVKRFERERLAPETERVKRLFGEYVDAYGTAELTRLAARCGFLHLVR